MPLKESEIAEKIQEEHERIKGEMAKIRKMIQAHVSREGFAKWRLDLLWLLRDFKTGLQRHFDLEEEGGFMDEVVRIAPHNWDAVKKLETEHRQMTVDVDGILEDLKNLEDQDDLKLDQIRARIGEFFAFIESHEAAEGDLLESTYLQDEGMAD